MRLIEAAAAGDALTVGRLIAEDAPLEVREAREDGRALHSKQKRIRSSIALTT